MFNRSPYRPSAFYDDWEGQPAQGWFYRWILGVAVPVGLAIYGITALLSREAGFSGRNASITLHDSNAVAFGTACLSAAVFVHCHYYWGNVFDQAWFAVLGKIVSACGFVGGMGYVLVRVGIFGYA